MTDVAKDMTADSQNSVYGDWYDETTKTYLSFKSDGSYIFGYGKYVENSGGTFTVDDKKIVLTMSYVLLDGKKVLIPADEKEDMILPYSFSLGGNLKFDSDNIALNLTSVPIDGVPETSTSNLVGYWMNLEIKETIRFDSSGRYIKTYENGDVLEGTYKIDSGQLIITTKNNENISYDIEFSSKTRMKLMLEGKASSYERMGD